MFSVWKIPPNFSIKFCRLNRYYDLWKNLNEENENEKEKLINLN